MGKNSSELKINNPNFNNNLTNQSIMGGGIPQLSFKINENQGNLNKMLSMMPNSL